MKSGILILAVSVAIVSLAGCSSTPEYHAVTQESVAVYERHDFREIQQRARLKAMAQARARGANNVEVEAIGADAGNRAGVAAFEEFNSPRKYARRN